MAQANIDIIEKFKRIKALLSQRETPITSLYLAKQFNISQLESSSILNEFLLHEENALNKYIIIFQVEQLSNNTLTIKIIPSYSSNLETTLTSKETISFSTFAIVKKSSISLVNDYNMLIIPNEIQSRYDFGAIALPNSRPKPVISTKKEDIKKVSTHNNNNAKPKTVAKQPQKDIKSNDNNKSKDNKFNQEFHSKLTVVGQDEENMYGGFKPNKQEDDNVKRRNTDDACMHVNDSKKVNKPNQPSFADDNANIISHIEEQEDYGDAMDVDGNNEPRKILKKRKVKKTITKANEKGYMVTSDEWIEEEYWSDEKPMTKPKQTNAQRQPVQGNKKGKKAASNQSSIFSFFNK